MEYLGITERIGRFIILLLLFGTVSVAIGQPIVHSKHWYAQAFRPEASVATSDNCIITCGYLDAFPIGLLEKTDHTGKVLWVRSISDNSHNFPLYFYAVKLFPDESILVGAISNNIPVVFKFSSSGDLLWHRRYVSIQDASLLDVCPTSDGGIAVVALTTVFKTDSVGNPLWAHHISPNPGVNLSVCYSISEMPDSNLVLCGRMELPPQPHQSKPEVGLLLKISQAGGLLQSASYKSPDSHIRFFSHINTSDNDIVIRGLYILEKVDPTLEFLIEPLLVKCHNINDIRWANRIGFFSDDNLIAIASKDSTIVGLTNATGGPGAPASLHLVATDLDGNVTQVEELPNVSASVGTLSGFTREALFGAIIPSSNFYSFDSVLNGCNIEQTLCTSTPVLLIDTMLAPTLTPITVSNDTIPLIIDTPESQFIMYCATNGIGSTPERNNLFPYPNPVTSSSVITITVPLHSSACELILRDLTGREVYRTQREAATSGEQIQIPTTGLANGVYTIELLDPSNFTNIWRGKVMVE